MKEKCCLAFAAFACVLLGAPAWADSFGVSLSGSGSAGDACQIQPQIGEEAFSFSDSGTTYVSDGGSAVGFDNGWPNPPRTLTGCSFSPVFANVASSGIVMPGVMKLDASASMGNDGLLSAGSNAFASYFDTFIAVSGGTYLLTFSINSDLTADPSGCPGTSNASLQYNAQVSNSFGSTADRAFWSLSNCDPDPGPGDLFGAVTVLNSDTVQFTVTVGAGGTFGANASLGVRAGAGENQSADADASDTAILDITGVNGATYTAASGTVYNFQEVTTPEPGTLQMLLTGALLMVPVIRRRLR